MKSLLIVFLLSLSCVLQAQTAADIFDKNASYPYTWLGIDYSHVKVVESLQLFGGSTYMTADDVKKTYFKSWNELIVKERSKYSIEEMMHKNYVAYDIAMITQINDSANVKDLVSPGPPSYTPEQIQEFVNQYPLENRNGIGVLFVAESMNKRLEQAYYHVVILNMSTKQILIQQRVKGIPGGAGLRNYWAGSYREVMEQVGEHYYGKWKSVYAKKSTQPKSKPAW